MLCGDIDKKKKADWLDGCGVNVNEIDLDEILEIGDEWRVCCQGLDSNTTRN